ncbi:MAG TPA: glycosyl transferase, partial [Kiritimatiellia bacterium]|nr:glycosyl transferase [Kiritimatiellia bacterium]
FIALTERMLGARPGFAGLTIGPCIPASWKQARIVRRFRGTRYDIRISNPSGVSRGVKEIKVDGQRIEGVVLPMFRDHGVHVVEVLMG